MEIDDERIQYAIECTKVLRSPKQHLSTLGTTNIGYYLVTEPAYSDTASDAGETVIREGRVVVERPRIVTPYYLSRLEGFSPDARKYFETLIRMHGANAPGLFYAYKNELKGLNIVGDSLPSVVNKLNDDIDKRGDSLAAIIKGVDELWDVSVMKFIYEVTRSSIVDNIRQMQSRGLLDVDSSGIPADARMRIEELFKQVAKGEREPRVLKEELDHWSVFGEYEDRFLMLFKK